MRMPASTPVTFENERAINAHKPLDASMLTGTRLHSSHDGADQHAANTTNPLPHVLLCMRPSPLFLAPAHPQISSSTSRLRPHRQLAEVRTTFLLYFLFSSIISFVPFISFHFFLCEKVLFREEARRMAPACRAASTSCPRQSTRESTSSLSSWWWREQVTTRERR
jgi:hypothetical protein